MIWSMFFLMLLMMTKMMMTTTTMMMKAINSTIANEFFSNLYMSFDFRVSHAV